MLKRFLIIAITTLALISNALAGTDGELILKKNKPSEIKDCSEKFNRATFAFNQVLDGAIFKPVAIVYKKLPSPLRAGVGNSLDNLSNLITIPNNVLQGDLKQAGAHTARLLINSTIGILGISDPTDSMGLQHLGREDYGQTLGTWGAGTGCYFVLPILGPTTVRDFSGTVVNFIGGDPWYNVTVKNDTNYVKDSDYYITRGTDSLDFRAKNIESFDSLERNSVDFYASVKSLYLQDRKNKISNSKTTTETQDDSDWEEIDAE